VISIPPCIGPCAGMSRSILGCSCRGEGNAAWRLGWKTVEKPIGEKALIPDVEPGDGSVDGQRRSRFDVGGRGASGQLGYAGDTVDATSDRRCVGAIRIVPLDRASFPLRRRGRFSVVFVRSRRCCDDLQSCSLVIVRDHDWCGSALGNNPSITVLEDEVNAKGRSVY
jgi:hypothetical protein